MLTVWTKHLSDATKADNFKKTVQSSKPVLDRAVEILNEEENQLVLEELNHSNYYIPGWDHRQAHINGMRTGYRKAIQLLNLDQGNK